AAAERAAAEKAAAEKAAAEKAAAEKAAAEKAAAEEAEAARVELERLDAEKAAAEEAAAEKAAAEKAAAEEAEGAVEETPPDMVKELLTTSGHNEDSQVSKQLVVDLGKFEEPEPELDTDSQPEPALAGIPQEKSGIMGAVKSAFSRRGRNHVHQLVEAPGGIGIDRFICEDCGFVSISSSD
ncbi:MAG: hypothetical protein O6923_07615, partial [Actinobacteria bacterium]|nr:hypothetical protein [Actinomycetota bacterium]